MLKKLIILLNTFSIGFDDKKHNESFHAKKVANYLGTNHNEFILKEKDAIDEIENIMNHFDEPFADSSALPTMLSFKNGKKTCHRLFVWRWRRRIIYGLWCI